MGVPSPGANAPRSDSQGWHTDLNAAEANRLLYGRIAATYDESEECVVDDRLRSRLSTALSHALIELEPRSDPRILDACGGSGNASLMLLEMGLRPVTVDISMEMLSILEAKALARGYTPVCIPAEISTFLETDSRSWDLIVFSSALHHLDDFDAVIDSALNRLEPGGILLTMFDPTRVSWTGRRLRRIDYGFHVVIRTPGRIPDLLKARLPHRASTSEDSRSIGIVAERHALAGIDDIALAHRLERTGRTILEHQRYFEGRFSLTRLTFQAIKQPTSFQMMVRTPGVAVEPSGPAARSVQAKRP